MAQIGDDSETNIVEGVRLLYRAVAGGNETLVARLLRAGVPVEGWRHFNHKKQNSSSNQKTLTPLHAACANGRASVASVLISAGASVTLTARHGATPLWLAASNKGENGGDSAEALVRMLLEAGASITALDDSRQSVLHAAARVGASTKVLKAIIEGHEHEMRHSKVKSKKMLLKRMGPMLQWRDA